MRAFFSIIFLLTGFSPCFSQNLLLNPGAELTPAGTNWTIASTGGATCAIGSAASTYSSWTMTPDNSMNYPFAHGGLKTFFSGCTTTVPGGPFELFQDIDVSTDAIAIDAGGISYVFAGYIQTPVAGQMDAGRFIVDYMNATGTIIGASYTSAYQSNVNCSCASWNLLTNTRLAPIGTRKVRVRLQTTIATGPAINAYFDDVTLSRSSTLPVVLISFKGSEQNGDFLLKWLISDAVDFSRFEIEKSTDTSQFLPVGDVSYLKDQSDYQFIDQPSANENRVFFRLKMIDIDGKFVYSSTIELNRSGLQLLSISPNPANKNILVTGLMGKGTIIIMDVFGNKMLETNVKSDFISLDLSRFPQGLYILSYLYNSSTQTDKFLIQ
jgi:hypothetical protein